MNHEDAGRYWNDNAEAWTRLVRAGHDEYRDHLNTPAFFEMLPEVATLTGLDIGCGEGHNTRMLAARGARMTAIDISEVFISHARASDDPHTPAIDYRIASAVELPFGNATFDFATGFMSLMDIPEIDRVLAETWRVLRPGGFLQFSISHPCFDTPHRRNLRDDEGLTRAIEVGDYFRTLDGDVSEWTFGAAPRELRESLRRFRTPRFTRPISDWLNLVIDAGFTLERLGEPRPSDEVVRAHPHVQDAQVVAYFLHVRARKPKGPPAGR